MDNLHVQRREQENGRKFLDDSIIAEADDLAQVLDIANPTLGSEVNKAMKLIINKVGLLLTKEQLFDNVNGVANS